MIKTIFANNSFITNVFNSVGQRVGAVDQAGLQINYGYDVSGQLTNVAKPLVPDPDAAFVLTNATWNYQYDQYGRLSVIKDAKDRPTTNTYDALGRQLTRRLPMGQTETNLYNSKGQLWKHIDFKGQTNEMRYDRFGRRATNFWFAHGSSYPSNSAEYYYDSFGQLTNITERSGTDASTTYASLGSRNRHYASVAEPGLRGFLLCGASRLCGLRPSRG